LQLGAHRSSIVAQLDKKGEATMDKQTAFDLLGGDASTVAKHCSCTLGAVYKWPNRGPLPRKVADTVLAARVRLRAQILQAQGVELDPLEAKAVEL
jgi:hypothetical protein